MWKIIIFQCDALERSRIQVHKMAWTCCVVSRGIEDRPRKEAGPADGSSSHLFHFHSPAQRVLQAPEGWPCSLQFVGLPGLPALVLWTWNLWGRRLALLCRFFWVILISLLLSTFLTSSFIHIFKRKIRLCIIKVLQILSKNLCELKWNYMKTSKTIIHGDWSGKIIMLTIRIQLRE